MTTREDPRWMRHGVTGAYVFDQCCTRAGMVVGDDTVWQNGEVWGERGIQEMFAWVWWDRDHAEEVVTWYRIQAPKDSNEMHQFRSARNVMSLISIEEV